MHPTRAHLPLLGVELEEVEVLLLVAEASVGVLLDDLAVAIGGEALLLVSVVVGERALVEDATRVGVEGRAGGVDGTRGRRG